MFKKADKKALRAKRHLRVRKKILLKDQDFQYIEVKKIYMLK